jgi:hypothetical protein
MEVEVTVSDKVAYDVLLVKMTAKNIAIVIYATAKTNPPTNSILY